MQINAKKYPNLHLLQLLDKGYLKFKSIEIKCQKNTERRLRDTWLLSAAGLFPCRTVIYSRRFFTIKI